MTDLPAPEFVICLLLFHSVVVQCALKGHLKPLGSHQPADGDILQIPSLTASDFYSKFVKHNQPVILRGLLNSSKPLDLWNDDYLHTKFGDEVVNVDFTKYENRLSSGDDLQLHEFLETYEASSDMYLITTLPKSMQKEFPLPQCLNSALFKNRLQDFVLWFSSGGTNSLLHYDTVENLYCQLFGSKHWFMVDPWIAKKHIIEDHPEGQYTSVNVSMVDMEKYPGLRNMPWWSARSYPGDCIYVPLNWWHQVHSEESRNMAVNIWWAPLFHDTFSYQLRCEDESKSIYLSSLNFTHGEWIRWSLSIFLQQNGGKADYQLLHESIVSEHTGENLIRNEDFQLLDSNSDGFLDLKELSMSPAELVHEAVQFVGIGAMNINGLSKAKLASESNSRSMYQHLEKEL
ncbi:jumonji C domain-containing protein 5-like [Clavelina lepadiformis]|uniref:jumonji C domain-containing protein 5-like n=1 Tax=Clavelina lepadiformis TaxID=159417 RepID=UPI0040436D78